MAKGILLVISGFSGSGKGTLVKRLIKKYDEYALSVSMTTRKPRAGEVDGVDYFFVSHEKFEQTIAENGLIEFAQYCDNYYGTPRAYVEQQLEAGRNVILEIEIQGATNIKKMFPEACLLFVTTTSAEILEQRLRGRKTEPEEVIAQRLARASEESKGMAMYDYIVINDDLETCVDDIHSLVKAAQNEPVRMKSFIEDMQNQLMGYSKGE